MSVVLVSLATLLVGIARADAPLAVPAAAPAPVAEPAPPVAPAPPASVPAAPPAVAAPAVAAPVQYECTSFPVRSTMAMGAFQAPADVSGARLNPTRLPAGWVPMGGSIGEGGAFVLACKPL
ncbi:MAG: hypothetical protein Q8P41_24420 [Pseudomonadota bacterium]|nr:hypothetical protein [Pseudomonadota bacterium]